MKSLKNTIINVPLNAMLFGNQKPPNCNVSASHIASFHQAAGLREPAEECDYSHPNPSHGGIMWHHGDIRDIMGIYIYIHKGYVVYDDI